MAKAQRIFTMDENPPISLPASHTGSLEEEVEQLFLQTRDDIYRYLVILGLGTEQAQEVTQEVFLRLFASLLNGDKVDHARAWMFRVAHNLAVRVWTREKIYQPLEPAVEESLIDANANPELAALEREQMRRFENAVDALSPQQQQCLFLRAEGFRYREIATIMGVSDSSVGEFLRRGISRLKKAFHA